MDGEGRLLSKVQLPIADSFNLALTALDRVLYLVEEATAD